MTSTSLANEDYCHLTTTGRVTGKPHEIEIWFGMDGDTIYLLSGGGDKSDWVKMAHPAEGEDWEAEIHGAGALRLGGGGGIRAKSSNDFISCLSLRAERSRSIP